MSGTVWLLIKPSDCADTPRRAHASGNEALPARRLRILLHDYGAYAFVAQLARELARRGHHLNYVYSGGLRNGRGPVSRRPDDPATLTFGAIQVDDGLDRYVVADRLRLERRYAAALGATTASLAPDVVLSTNSPLFVLRWLRPELERRRIPLVNWLQDLHSVAIGERLSQRMGAAGRAGAAALEQIESRLLRACAHVVAVSPDFAPVLERWRVPDDRVTVVPNWAELRPVRDRHNPFSAEHGLDDRTTLLYAGTLGLKHEPLQLVLLAETFRDRPDVAVVVVSEGLGRQWLETERAARGLSNLVLLDFQPHDRVDDVLASADVLLSMIRPEAGRFSVPSKVTSYLVAGRAQLAALPSDNLSARMLAESGAGVVVDPGDREAWAREAGALVDDPRGRDALGRNGRVYAEAHFQLGPIADQFEVVLRRAMGER